MFTEDKAAIQEQWNTFLTQPHYVSVQYLQFKNHGLGSTPMQSYHNLMMPTQHVSHHAYSEIETTRRKAMDFEKRKIHELPRAEPSCGFAYPCDHWNRFTPDIRTFRRFPKFKNPFTNSLSLHNLFVV